jgi:hypothetical protein
MNRHLQIRLACLTRANIWLYPNKSAPWLIDLLDDKRVDQSLGSDGRCWLIGSDLPVGAVSWVVESYF